VCSQTSSAVQGAVSCCCCGLRARCHCQCIVRRSGFWPNTCERPAAEGLNYSLLFSTVRHINIWSLVDGVVGVAAMQTRHIHPMGFQYLAACHHRCHREASCGQHHHTSDFGGHKPGSAKHPCDLTRWCRRCSRSNSYLPPRGLRCNGPPRRGSYRRLSWYQMSTFYNFPLNLFFQELLWV
jgi:hypothetical protein